MQSTSYPHRMRQCEPQRIPGWFHLPESPAQRVPGILTWEPLEGAVLELIGGFSPQPNYQANPNGNGVHTTKIVGDVRPGTIYGETTSGNKLSIWDAQRGNYTAGMASDVHEEFWSSSWICVGAHVGTPQDAAFSTAVLALDGLYYLTDDGRFCAPQWAKSNDVEHPHERLDNGTLLSPYVLPVIGGFHAEYVLGQTDEARYAVNTRATRPPKFDATEAFPDLKLQMMTRNLRSGRLIELKVEASASIRLTDNATGSAADFMDRTAPILDLMRLATFDFCGVEAVALTTVDDQEVSLLSRIGESGRPEETHEPAATIFDFNDLPLDEYLTARTRLTDGREAAYAWSVLVGHCGYTPRLVEQYTSQVLAAAEGFHTWCLRNEAKKDLKIRLEDLHNMLAVELQTRLNINIDNWTKWAVWARHYVAHGGIKRSYFLSDNLQMLAIAKSVNLVTYLVALCELGVPVEKVIDALNNHPRLRTMMPYCDDVNQITHVPAP